MDSYRIVLTKDGVLLDCRPEDVASEMPMEDIAAKLAQTLPADQQDTAREQIEVYHGAHFADYLSEIPVGKTYYTSTDFNGVLVDENGCEHKFAILY